jgi:Zn-dependent M28 family amino/carboxypeptidase
MVSAPAPRKKILLALIALILLAAAALLLIGCPAAGTTKPANKTLAAPAKFLDSTKLIDHLRFLTSPEQEGREAGSPGGAKAKYYIADEFKTLGLDKPGGSYLQPFKLERDTSRSGGNVAGIIKGTLYPDTYIVVTAHFDHLGNRNGTIYYGADDNASGTANLLTLARYFKNHPLQHSLLFVAFDAEEIGLLGSKYFVDHLPVPQSSIIMNLNMDMISRSDKNEIYASGIFHYPFLKKFVDSAQTLTPISIRFGHDDAAKGGAQDWTTQSDHYSFHLKKIPFLYFGVEDHADYHKPSDTFDKINKSFYYQVCSMIANTIMIIDKQEKLN